MIVYDLVCAQDHRFEGWFASNEDYARQQEQTMIRCPLCDDAAIERRLSANVQVRHAAPPAVERKESTASESSMTDADHARALQLLRRMVSETENVGAKFPEEARKIHYEETAKRAIRGQASPEEAADLRDEGIDFMSLPNIFTRDLN